MAGCDERDCVLCVDIGGTSTKVGTFDTHGQIRIFQSITSRGPAEEFAQSLGAAMAQARRVASSNRPHVSGAGVAVAGFLNEERDRMIYNSNLPWLEGYPLRDSLMESLDMRVELEVDSNAAAMAEQQLGVGQGSSRFLCITVGTGLGVGMIVNGKPLRFAYGCMGDPGHIVIERDGPACPCGGRGCAEMFVSAPVLAEEYRVKAGAAVTTSLRDVIERARGGDEIARAILERAGEWLGIATASFANTFFPDRIAFAGGLAEAGDLVLKAAEKAFYRSASKFARDQASLSRGSLGAMATITGAAYSILNRARTS